MYNISDAPWIRYADTDGKSPYDEYDDEDYDDDDYRESEEDYDE